MNKLLGLSILALVISFNSFSQEYAYDNNQAIEISERLKQLDNIELNKRKIELENELLTLQSSSDDENSARISAIDLELSIIEQLLIISAA